MSMDKVIFPEERNWISPLVNLGEKAESLRRERQEFMKPILDATDVTLEHDKKQLEKRNNAMELANLQAEKTKKKLFDVPKPIKKKGRRRTKSNVEDEEEEFLDEFENGYELPHDFDEILDEDDEDFEDMSSSSGSENKWETDDSDDERPKHMRKYNSGLDEIFIFHSDESDDEDTAKVDGMDQTALENAETSSEPEAEPTEENPANEENDKKADEPGNGEPSEASKEVEKDISGFDLFHKYGFELNSGLHRNSAEDLLPLKYILMGTNTDEKLGNKKIKLLAKETSPHLATVEGEVIVDNPIIRGTELPLLAGPIQEKALESLGSLALYTGLSEEPGRFQWKMSHVVELLTAQLNQSLLFDEDGNEVGDDPRARELVQDDFIVTATMYQSYEQPEGDAAIELKTVQEPEYAFEIEILGSQTLMDLAKMLRCQNDLYCTRPYLRPNIAPVASAAYELCKEDLAIVKNPEFLILLNGIMYTNPSMAGEDGNLDESKLSSGRFNLTKLAQWTRKHSEEFGEVQFGDLNCKIKDLTLRLGYPYVYIHQEACEHLIVFNTVRLPRDIDNTVYPRYNRVGKHPVKSCTVDNDSPARWVVVTCDRLPQDPMFLCDDCVSAYCYKRTNSRVPLGEFKLFPYLQLAHYL